MVCNNNLQALAVLVTFLRLKRALWHATSTAKIFVVTRLSKPSLESLLLLSPRVDWFLPLLLLDFNGTTDDNRPLCLQIRLRQFQNVSDKACANTSMTLVQSPFNDD